jgi:hypothetical protein
MFQPNMEKQKWKINFVWAVALEVASHKILSILNAEHITDL